MAFTDFVVVGCSGVAAADDSPVILSTVFAVRAPSFLTLSLLSTNLTPEASQILLMS